MRVISTPWPEGWMWTSVWYARSDLKGWWECVSVRVCVCVFVGLMSGEVTHANNTLQASEASHRFWRLSLEYMRRQSARCRYMARGSCRVSIIKVSSVRGLTHLMRGRESLWSNVAINDARCAHEASLHVCWSVTPRAQRKSYPRNWSI